MSYGPGHGPEGHGVAGPDREAFSETFFLAFEAQEAHYFELAEEILGAEEAERLASSAAAETLASMRVELSSIPPFCDFLSFFNEIEID